MKTSEAFPGNWLRAADLAGRKVKVTIERVSLEEMGDERKPVLWFVGKDKGLVMNKTNANAISEHLGTDEMDDWRGCAIVLVPSKTDFQGKRVDCIRTERANGPAKPVPPPREEQDFSASDEDVPF